MEREVVALLVEADGDSLNRLVPQRLAGVHVLGGDVDDAVGVDVEGDLDLGEAAGGRGHAGELEAAEGAVVVGHLALALEDVDVDGGLGVGRGREGLLLAGRDGGVARDEDGQDAAEGPDVLCVARDGRYLRGFRPMRSGGGQLGAVVFRVRRTNGATNRRAAGRKCLRLGHLYPGPFGS